MPRISPSPILSFAPRSRIRLRGAFFVAAMAAFPLAAGVSRAQQQGPISPFPTAGTPSVAPGAAMDRRGDDTSTELANEKRLKELNILRQKEITTDAAKLLLLATELKANLDESPQAGSSTGLIRKAEQIEKLARNVRTRMTEAIGAGRLNP